MMLRVLFLVMLSSFATQCFGMEQDVEKEKELTEVKVPEVTKYVVGKFYKGTPILYVHGFGANGKIDEDFADFFRRRIVGFDFKDAVDKDGNMDFRAMNLGQEPDAEYLLQVLEELYDEKNESLDIVAASRGAAAYFKTLHMLCNADNEDFTTYKDDTICPVLCKLKKDNKISGITSMMLKGSVVLFHPMMNQHEAIRNSIRQVVGTAKGLVSKSVSETVYDYTPNFVISSVNCAKSLLEYLPSFEFGDVSPDSGRVSGSVVERGLHYGTRYNLDAPTPIFLLKNLFDRNEQVKTNLKLCCIVAKDKSDKVVGHEHDEELKNIVEVLNENGLKACYLEDGDGHVKSKKWGTFAKEFLK